MEFQIPILIAPLDGERAGADPQTLEEHDALVAEIAKMDGIEKVSIDWHRIAEICTTLLSESTKDLKTANYLVYAWFQNYQFLGLKSGFELLNGLVTGELSEELYPKRKKRQEKARAAPFLWLAAKLEKYFSINEIDDIKQLDNAEEAIKLFKNLDISLRDYLADEAPMFSELKSTFNRFTATIEESKAKQKQEAKAEQKALDSTIVPAQQPAAAEKSKEPITLPKIEASSVASSADINKALSSAGNVLKTIAIQLRESQNYSPNAFYLNRTAKWMMIQELPANGILVRQPNEQTLKNLQALEASKNNIELLTAAEREFTNGAIFYLALHRYVYNALMALGQELCANVVLTTTANFIARFPEITNSTFKDGEPFVDQLTKTWLESKTAKSSGAHMSDSKHESDIDMPWHDVAEEATALVAEGKLSEAIQLFQDGMNSANGTRASVYWGYEMAAMLAKIGHDEIVLMKLDHIHELVHGTQVSEWQPELSIKVLKLMLSCHKRIQQKKKYEQPMLDKVNTLKHELVKLAPSEVLAFTEAKT